MSDAQDIGLNTKWVSKYRIEKFGEVAEWLKAHAWKVCLGLNLTRVRIPLSPPNTKRNPHLAGFFVYGGER